MEVSTTGDAHSISSYGIVSGRQHVYGGIVSNEIVVPCFVEYGVRRFLRNLNTYMSCYIGPHSVRKTRYFKVEVFIIRQQTKELASIVFYFFFN